MLRVAGLKVPSRLPVRIVAFLDDAHRRGVLRQVGATYQFRHLRLHQYLARTHPYHDRVGDGGHRSAVLRALYAATLVAGLVMALVVYVGGSSETFLIRVVALWLFPVVFRFYGLVSEALLGRVEPGVPLSNAARGVVREYGKPAWLVVHPFLLLPWRNPLPILLATTAFWAVLVQWFLVAVFPNL
ncbi:hypothetical protein ABZ816_33675 [Actinosynnema sp. NPDC047251]|uniref:Putative membrane protein n=1 Tax=Saccharothrix espanaensis (strain ATCC 51144 / DSM 44229 / JCM 9112 / NBRC 15066 / NRRL 15764) TaxID=1179773 RepID=K0K6C0_SACES|nr:hypothetical protein [Saccharothrix espanaensis]CCH33067.1 putative membrane protein [Saccharothrix espanaensis DSM 44229]